MSVKHYWNERDDVFDQDVSPSGFEDKDVCRSFRTLTPEIVKGGVAVGVEVLHGLAQVLAAADCRG